MVTILVLCLIQKNINNSTLFSYHVADVAASDLIQHRLEGRVTATEALLPLPLHFP